jgi:hexosaminidase
LGLQWEVERTVVAPPATEPRSRAVLTLTNHDSRPLPAQGWAIYFNTIAGVVPGPALEGQVRFERVGGSLYRLRPEAGFQELASGQAARIVFLHPEVMIKIDKAPQGPYLVFDRAPETGLAIADYRLLMPSHPEQLDTGPADAVPYTTPETIYQRNAAIAELAEDALPPVFPTPSQYQRRIGSLRWTALPAVLGAPALRNETAFAKALLRPYFGAAPAAAGAPVLRLLVEPITGQDSPEAYALTVDPVAGITLTGNTAAGVARGLQSLRDLLPVTPRPDKEIVLPALTLVDAPRFEYRGVQMDVARNFQDKATVLRMLDLMARYKLNKLHFHLTDDEGWRLEIAGIPELTAVGARRGHTLDSDKHLQPAYGSGPDVGDPHGSGYYSRADYIEILKYAAARHIEVIPEIEMPGHARAAVKAMESRDRTLTQAGGKEASRYLLSDPRDRSVFHSAQSYTDNVIDPGLPSTYTFIAKVVAEVAKMHRQAGAPLRTLHVGGDELPHGAWEKSPASRALMQRLKLAGTAELWDHFYNRVAAILHKHGLVASGWEELGVRKTALRGETRVVPNPEFLRRGISVYVWNNLDDAQDLAHRLANAGYKTVLAPVTNLYFDMAHNKNPEEPGHNWGPYLDLDTVFDFIPLDMTRRSVTDATPLPGREGLTEYGRGNVRGLEGTLFSETLRDPTRIDYMLLPRLLGLAERAWAADPAWVGETDPAKAKILHDAAWSVFVNQLGKRVLPRLAADHADVNYRIAPPGLKRVDGKVLVNHQLPGLILRYTTDGSEPGAGSALVAGPIEARGVIQVAAFDRSGRRGRASRIDNP